MSANREFGRIANGSISMIWNDDLVVLVKIKTAQNGIHATRGIVNEDKVFAVYANKPRYLFRGHAQARALRRGFPNPFAGKLPQKKARRLPFDFIAKSLLGIQN